MDSGGFSTSASPNGHFQLGLVGAGRMGRTHLEVLEGSPGIAIAGVAEPREDVRAALPATVRSFASLPAMLGECELDGVLVAAPTDLHLEIVRRLMAERLPVLCEKPCGLTAAEARASAQTAAAAGVPLQVAYWRRFVPGLRQLRDRIAAGELGVIHLVTCYQWDEQPPSPIFRALVPTSRAVPAETASGRSVLSRSTRTGLPREGASS